MDSLTAGAGSLAQTQEWWRYDHVNDVAIQPAMRLEFLARTAQMCTSALIKVSPDLICRLVLDGLTDGSTI
jgi:hypothetical protein